MHHTVGIDLRVLQIGHQFRGIGEHTKHLIANFPSAPNFAEVSFVFYTYSDGVDPTQFIKSSLRRYPKYQIEDVGPSPAPMASTVQNYLSRMRHDYRFSSEEQLETATVDSMLFIDFQLGVPEHAPYQKTLIMYDLIPHLFPEEYHPNYRAGRQKGASVRAAGTDAYRNWQYTRMLQRSTAHADRLLAISEHTRQDVVRELSVDESKIYTVPLGVEAAKQPSAVLSDINAITANDRAKRLPLDNMPFLFYLGGSDFRRRIPDLFKAFEQLRTKEVNVNLVLAGADFQNVQAVREQEFREALADSDFADDIYFLGYISDNERIHLYRAATAFVYPTLYEGFGLPILEAMAYGCPVITYANSSTVEVGGDAALYASNVDDITRLVSNILDDPALAAELKSAGQLQTKKFDWEATAAATLNALVEPSEKTSRAVSTV